MQGFDAMMVRAMGVWSFVRMILFKFSNKDFFEDCGYLLFNGIRSGAWWMVEDKKLQIGDKRIILLVAKH